MERDVSPGDAGKAAAAWHDGHRRHRQHGNPFSLRGPVNAPDFAAVFGRTAPLALDIGFGAGSFLLELAQRHPEWNVLGLEIRPHFVGGVLARAAALGLTNLHAVLANANVHLDALVPERSLAFVSLNFPDPWFKRRHQKRRVLQPEWLSVLASKLQGGGEFHAMTDYEPLARQMRLVLEADTRFENLEGRGSFAAASTTGITSEREVTHERRAEPIYRLRFRLMPG
jgi:tRNA (guanine-N7-)-methyltransferase